MTQRSPGEVTRLLGRQADVISRAQALAAGMTRHAIQARLDSGRWQRMHAGVYAAYSGRPTRESLMWAAVLGARGGGVLCHETAAELHGLVEAREGRGDPRHGPERAHRSPDEGGRDPLLATREGERWKDMRRDNFSAMNGWLTFRYSYADVMERPCQIADEIARALRVRGCAGTGHRCGPSCAPGDPTVLADPASTAIPHGSRAARRSSARPVAVDPQITTSGYVVG